MRTGLIVAAVVALLAGASRTRAQDEPPPTDEERARELFDRAVPLVAEQRYGEAHDLLVHALELDPRASTAFNLASVLVGLNRAREADALLDRVEAGDFGELPDAHAQSVAALRAAIRAQVGHLAIRGRGAPAIDVELDGEAVGTIGEGAVIEREVDPGAHEVRGAAGGHTTATERVTIAPGERRSVELVLAVVLPEAPPADRVVPEDGERDRGDDGLPGGRGGGSTWVVVAGVGVAALAAAAVVVLVLALTGGGDERPFDCDPVFGCTDV